MDSLVRQRVLLDLLAYSGEGNFASFDRIASKVWKVESRNLTTQRLIHNQMQACHMGGFIDAFETETSLRWSANTTDSGLVKSNRPKRVWRSSSSDSELAPLIVDVANNVLLVGEKTPASGPFKFAFNFRPDSFFGSIPSLSALSNQYIRREKWRHEERRQVEKFNSSTSTWEETPFDEISDNCLIRIRGDFSGRSYFVVIGDLRMLFRISNPEWAHLLAGSFLSWNFAEHFRFDGETLRVNARIKLPGLIKRFLFANSSQVQCGSDLLFKNFCEQSYSASIKFLSGSDSL